MQKSIFVNSIYKFMLNIFNLIVPIIIGPYVLRKLGPELMGVINYSQAIFAYFFIFASFGVYQYGLREISRVRDDKEKLESTFTSLFIVTVITNIIITILYVVFIYYKYQGTSMYVACMILTFNLISNVFYIEWVNEALENYNFITIKTIIIRLIYIILIFTMVKNSNDYESYLIILALSTFLNNIISYIYVRRNVKFRFDSIYIIKHIKPMILVVVLSNVSVLYTQLDKLMLGSYKGTNSVAFYTMAQNISYMINTALLTLIHVSIPRLGNYIINKSKEQYLSLLNSIASIYLMIIYPVGTGMLLLAKEIVLIYGGVEYADAFPILMAFSVYIITLGYEAILSNQVMYVNGCEKQQVKLALVFGVFNLIGNIIILKLNVFNETTSLIITIFSNIFLVIAQQFYILKKLKIEYNIFSINNSKYLFISLLFIPITSIIKFICSDMYIEIISIIVINAILYLSILLLIKDKVLYSIINSIIIKFRWKNI